MMPAASSLFLAQGVRREEYGMLSCFLLPRRTPMRTSKTPLLKFAACFAILAILLGGAAAGATQKNEQVSKPAKSKIHTGPYKGEPFFLKTDSISQCGSGCCTAYASCPG